MLTALIDALYRLKKNIDALYLHLILGRVHMYKLSSYFGAKRACTMTHHIYESMGIHIK